MFGDISENYDKMNDILSLGIHHLWRKKAVKLAGIKNGDSILDCAAGTGEFSIAFKKAVGESGKVLACDFSPIMLSVAEKKFKERNFEIKTETADVLNLHYSDNTFDASSISFGIRNVDNIKKCLEEMARVVKPTGKVIVLELGQPNGFISPFYRFYSKFIIPFMGKYLVGNRKAYNYLHSSASRFPCGDEFVNIMEETGKFNEIRCYPVSFGIAYIYLGIKK